MRTVTLFGSLLVSGALVAASIGCSGSTSDKDAAGPVADTANADAVVADTGAHDLTVPDLGSDDNVQPRPDTGPDISYEDVYGDLPRLPPDKVFTTRYAAGTGMADVTPTEPVNLGGFGACPGKPDKCRISEGIHDPISATAIALADTQTGEVVIFVGIDIVGFFRYDNNLIHVAATPAFAERHGVYLEGARVVVNCTHSHSSPDTAGIWGAMNGDVRDTEPFIEMVRAQAVEAALEAFGNLQDVNLVFGKGSAPNNDDDDQSDDKDVFVLKGSTPAGDTVFTLTRWSGHQTSYGHKSNGISADYLGVFRPKMEADLGGTAAFLQGPIGSVYAENPEGCTMEDQFPEGFQDPDLETEPGQDSKAACVGTNLATAAQEALLTAVPVAETGISFGHYSFDFHPTTPLLIAFAKLGPIPLPYVDVNDPTTMISSEFSWVKIGDLNYLSMPGEAFPSFAKRAREIGEEHGLTNVITLGLTQDWMGYLLTTEQWTDPDLGYHRGLSAGENVYPEYMARWTTALEEQPVQ